MNNTFFGIPKDEEYLDRFAAQYSPDKDGVLHRRPLECYLSDEYQSGSISPLGEFGWDGAAGGFSMVDTQNRLSLTYFQHSHKWNGEMQNEMRNALYSCINEG